MQLRKIPLAIKLGLLAALAAVGLLGWRQEQRVRTKALLPLFITASLAVLLMVGFLTKTESITAVNPVPCPTLVPVATATPDGGPTYTPTVTFTPCLIKLTSTPAPQTAEATPPVTAMSLSITNSFLCVGSGQPGEVCVLAGNQFDVVVNADAIPLPNGYQFAGAWINYGDDLGDQALLGEPKRADPDAIPPEPLAQAIWLDCVSATFLTSSSDNGGNANNDAAEADCLAGIIGGPTPSFYVGPLYAFTLTCTASASSHLITLEAFGGPNAGTDGALYTEFGTLADLIPTNSGVPDFIVDSVTVNCVPKLPEPGDTDGDGCSDQRELGPDETLGGLRDFTNPWDFYDVLGGDGGPPDQIVDLPNDILGVILHFSPFGYTPGTPSIVGNTTYDAFDRGAIIGANHWNRAGPDGYIDLPNDILGVILQFNHSCQ